MSFMIFDETGNAIDAFDDPAEATASLCRLVHDDPSMARKLALLSFDDDGNAVGEAEVAADVPDIADLAGTVVLSAPPSWIQVGARTFIGRWLEAPTEVPSLNGGISCPAVAG